jgi:hypothetical protein
MGDKVIRFPGPEGLPGAGDEREQPVSGEGDGSLGIPGLSADQEKALRIAMDGMSFVIVGIKPTGSGADFFTAVHGKRGELADAAPHLDGILQRALEKLGV